MPIIIPANSAVGGGGFNVDNSVRFDGTSGYLTRTPSSASDRKTWTWSAWVKRSSLSTGNQVLFEARDSSGFVEKLQFNSSDQLEYDHDIAGTDYTVRSDMLFRDTSAWYHIVIAKDTTQSTETNRLLFYANGQGLATTEFQLGYPPQNYDGLINSTNAHYVGANATEEYFSGYMSEAVLINAAQLAPTSFGEFDSDSGIWKPIDVSGLTFGTNGFYQNYQDSSALGNDVSGNNNDFSTSGLAAIDQTTDTCTNNFATLNPLYKQDGVFSESNLAYTIAASDFDSALSTIAPSLGKWYFETKITAQAGSNTTRSAFGICDVRDANLFSEDELGQNLSGRVGDTVCYTGNGSGNVLKNGSDQGSGFNTTYGTNDILSCAVDLDNGAVYYRKNGGSWFNSGNPESGASKTGAVTITTGQEYVFGNTAYAGSAFIMNFGNPAFTGTDQADGNDRGSFEYAVPSGYLALCSLNLSEELS